MMIGMAEPNSTQDTDVKEDGATPALDTEDRREPRQEQSPNMRIVDDPDADGFHLTDQGTVIIRWTGRDGDRVERECHPPTLAAYARIVDELTDARETLNIIQDENREFSRRLREVDLKDPDAEHDLNRLSAEFDIKRRRDNVKIRQLAFRVLNDTIRLTCVGEGTGPDVGLPEDAPVWVTMWGTVDLMLAHWEQTPFRGPAGTRRR